MMARATIVLLLAAAPAAFAQAQHSCPWLNAGTAARILGADVGATVQADSSWSGTCRFFAGTDSTRTIEILVGKTDTHPCESNATPLTGIGNQAQLCSSQASDGRNLQTVTARVRDRWFVITLAMPQTAGQRSPSSRGPSGPIPIEFLAEQVAGNLY